MPQPQLTSTALPMLPPCLMHMLTRIPFAAHPATKWSFAPRRPRTRSCPRLQTPLERGSSYAHPPWPPAGGTPTPALGLGLNHAVGSGPPTPRGPSSPPAFVQALSDTLVSYLAQSPVQVAHPYLTAVFLLIPSAFTAQLTC